MLLVKDIFSRKHFEHAVLVAGEQGIEKQIKWIHIMEKTDVENFVTGNVLVLTTGVMIQHDEQLFYDYLTRLAERGVSGLCIELGEYIQQIPPNIIARANELELPLILFTKIVPFIEITQDLHTLIIHQQYDKLKQLEQYSESINKYALKVNDTEKILQYMQRQLKVKVFFQIENGKKTALPKTKFTSIDEILDSYPSTYASCQQITLFDQMYGRICIYNEHQELSDLQLLILDRTVVTLSQYLMRDLYFEEKIENEHSKFFEKWLDGVLTEDEVCRFIDNIDTSLKLNGWMVMIHQLKREIMKKDLTYYKINLRQSLEKEGFHTFIVEQKNQLVFILSDLRGGALYKERMKRAMNEIVKQYRYDTLLAVGKYVKNFNMLFTSYKSAQEILPMRWKHMELSYFYEDLYLHHMIQVLQNNSLVMQNAIEKIDLLMEYDRKNNSNLIGTLKTYLQCNGLKKETAEKLFIVRQTLYHRLEKVEQILGHDFMSYENRLCLEVMLKMTEDYYKANFNVAAKT